LSVASAQTPSFNFQKLGSEEGLNNANIFNVEQHENGLLYITTQNGIYSYDGYNFTKLEIDSLRSNALIAATFKNQNELLLSLRDEGIASLDLKKRAYNFLPSLKLTDNNADNIIVTERFAFLLISRIKIVIVDLGSGKVIQDALKKQENLAYCIFKTAAGKVLLGRSDGLYDITNGQQTKLPVLDKAPVYAITQDKEGRLFLGSNGKIIILNKGQIEREIEPVYKTKSNTFLPEGLSRSINKVLCDDFGRIWFTSYPEESLYLYENNTVYDVFQILNIPPTLIKCMFRDASQNIWVGTNNDGLYFIQNAFFNSINFEFGGKNLNINQVFLKDQLLVAATSNGLFGLNLMNYQTKILSKPDEVFLEPIFSISEGKDVIYYSKINEFNLFPSIFFAADKSYRFKPVIAKLFYPISDNESVVADWNLNILRASGDGTKTLETLISFTDYRISVNVLLKHKDILYVGTSNGLFTYDFKTKQQHNINKRELNFNINDLCVIDGAVFAAHEGGLTNVTTGQLIERVGNFNLNTVRKIRQFSDQVWLGTLDGVLVCDQSFNLLKILNKSNGLLSNSINDFSFSEGRVGIATARGVSVSELKNILKYNARLKPVTVNAVVSSQTEIFPKENAYYLAADQENISIHFYSPLFAKPNKQMFRWRMDEGEWKYFNNNSFEAVLTGGNHLIDIQASVDDIQWSESSSLRLSKEEKLSETSSGYLLYSAIVIVLIILISVVWVRRIKIKSKKRLAEAQQVNLLKHQAMNSLLSPHFIFNSLTSIQNYINTNNGLRASEYLAKFSRLIRMIIEKAAQSHITLHDELARLTYYLELEKERFKNKFDYSIHIDEHINTHEIQIPNMIIQPYVENCIIHGILPKQEHGELSLNFNLKEGNKLIITIEDNGIGLIKAKEHAKTGHKSLGTSTIQSILEVNSKLSGKKQKVSMRDKSTIDSSQQGTIIVIELEL
jgi:sensor histidine kinase YesM